jgi:photosystem II stability/assembly factor-like uncharacterized protein
MSDFKERLEQERRRFAMSGDSFRDLERRRDRMRRNRRLASGLVALVIAAAGVGGGLYAFRSTGSVPVVDSPTPPVGRTTPPPGPTPTSPSPAPPVTEAVSSPSGPVQFIDDQHGWLVYNGEILTTSDGGASWQGPLNPGSRQVGAIDFLDLLHGWAVGQGGILQTVDGGASWSVVSDQAFSTVDFVDAETGWAIRSGGSQFVRTDDGGRTWTSEGHEADSVCASDGEHAWSAGLGGDGGVVVSRWDASAATWIQSPIPVPASEPWTATIRCSADGQQAFVLLAGSGAAGHVAYAAFEATAGSGSTDEVHPVLVASFAAGELGLDAYQDDDPYPGVFTVVDPGVAYFLNWCPACDGSWAALIKTEGDPAVVANRNALPPSGNPAPPVGISFVDPDHGWVLFYSGLLLVTDDGGQTWTGPCQPNPTSCFGITSVP